MIRDRRRRFLVATSREAGVFVSGILLSAIVSVIIGTGFTWSRDLIVSCTIVLILIVIYFFYSSTQRIQEMVDTIATDVDYVEEPYREGVSYRGDVYKRLEEIIHDAQSRILVFGAAAFDQGPGANHQSRAAFLDAIVSTIRGRTGKGFKYVRILQIPESMSDLSVKQLIEKRFIAPTTAEHCRKVLELERSLARKSSAQAIAVEIHKKVVKGNISPFIIVDDHYLIVETDAVAPNGEPYIANFFILDDKPGRIMPSYERHFDRLHSGTTEIQLEEFQ